MAELDTKSVTKHEPATPATIVEERELGKWFGSPTQSSIRVFGRFFGLRPAALVAKIDEPPEFLDLGIRSNALECKLSGGFRRRLAVATSLINRSENLILDGPTSGLDPAVRRPLPSRIRTLAASGTTVLMTTHYMGGGRT